MKFIFNLATYTVLFLAGCAASPEPMYLSLDAGNQGSAPQGRAPSVVITRTSIPDVVDRPQLAIHGEAQQLQISERWRWAAPLRREIPRQLAFRLGGALGSGQVVSLPADSQAEDVDFRLELDVLRFELLAGQGAAVDIRWRLWPRQGNPITGRSEWREPVAGGDVGALVAAQRLALDKVAGMLASEIRRLGWR